MAADDQVDAILHTLASEAGTLVRSPSSTVAPPRDGAVGRRALEVLRGLTFDPHALVEEAELGRGGMGVVRLATQVALDRKVAVKALRAEHRGAHDVEALLSEAWLTGALEHPNILPVYSVALDAQGLPLIVMKRIEGRTWTTLLKDPVAMARHAPGKAALDEHLSILMQVCNAVHFAHARGVVHRDLKPDNVMVGTFGEVYVVDWGIATPPGPCDQLAGTPAYMAPEMLGGANASITPQTDVYLLGAMLFEVLTGAAPHKGSTPGELVEHVLHGVPQFNDDAPEELVQLARACLSPAPEDRPESALEVRQALQAFLEHQGSLALTLQSEQRAAALAIRLAAPRPDATAVHELFSACRFGFQQALSTWPGNHRARAGLDGVLGAMIAFELEHGSAGAARGLLSELAHPEARLVAAVEAAEHKEAEQARELARLQALASEHDPRSGTLVRSVMASLLGLFWIASPALSAWLVPDYEAVEAVGKAPVALASALALGAALWRWRNRISRVNRQLLQIVIFGMLVQVIFSVAWYLTVGDLGPRGVPVFSGYWFVLTGAMAVALMPGIWPTALAFLAVTLSSLAFPEHRQALAAAGNAALCVNALWLFRAQRREQATALPAARPPG